MVGKKKLWGISGVEGKDPKSKAFYLTLEGRQCLCRCSGHLLKPFQTKTWTRTLFGPPFVVAHRLR